MMNPLMKAPLNSLSADTQNAFKTMQGELNVQKSLLAKCQAKLEKLKTVGKDIDKIAQTSNTE
jgi:hypothetical protein